MDQLPLPDVSPFRLFCRELWEEHRDEVFQWTGTPVTYTSEQFFVKNKWHIRSIFQARKRKNDNSV